MNNELIFAGDIMKDIITFIRSVRTQYNLDKRISLRLFIDTRESRITPSLLYLSNIDSVIKKLCNISSIDYDIYNLLESNHYFEHINISGFNIYIELIAINKDTQEKSIDNEIERLIKQYEKLQSKLSNIEFINKAPSEIIEKETHKMDFTKSKIDSLKSINLYRKCGITYYNLIDRFGHDMIGHFLNYDITPENIIELNKRIYK